MYKHTLTTNAGLENPLGSCRGRRIEKVDMHVNHQIIRIFCPYSPTTYETEVQT